MARSLALVRKEYAGSTPFQKFPRHMSTTWAKANNNPQSHHRPTNPSKQLRHATTTLRHVGKRRGKWSVLSPSPTSQNTLAINLSGPVDPAGPLAPDQR